MDCSKIKVVKKDGTREDFNVQKVLSAISKSAERAMITFSRAERNFICDFERGFIRAETYSYEDLVEYGTPLKVKEAGKVRLEGKDYVVRDGDIVLFRFNV